MKYSPKVFYWLPRILAILAILFISMFALDAFSSDDSFIVQLGDFIMHLIPSFVLLFTLILSWKRELLGGIIFMVIGLGMSPFVYKMNYNMNQSFWTSLGVIMTITIPFFIIGVLFLVSYFKKKNS